MKTSLRKLRGFASLHKNADLREKRDHKIPARQDELLQASQFCYEPRFLLMHWIATFSKLGAHELALGNLFACLKRPSHVYLFLGNIDSPEEDVLEMRSCYDSLLSAAAATANSAYEFSEALKEMGTCLLEKTSLNDDEESSRVLLNLGKAQFELQKLVDSYRVHIIQTITTPSESLFKELQTVEEMKRQCDDKRDIYKFILATQREKGRARHGKGESYALQQLQVARDDYEEETNLFIFRLKSLKQGQSRSLLTQASRHHAAQLNFFRKGVKALEMVEPDVKVVAEQQHIDYDFIGLEDDDTEDDEYNGYGSDANDDGELSFDYGHSEHIQDAGLTHRQSMELDQDYLTETSATTGIQLVSDKSHGDFPSFGRAPMTGSQSAPILPEMKPVLSERIKQMSASPPTRFHSYVLPTPADARNSFFAASRPDNKAEWPKQLWHSSPLEPNKPAEALKVEQSSPITLNISRPALRESGTKSSQTQLHPPAEGMLFSQSIFHSGASDNKKIKRQAFSGPLTGKSWSNSPKLSTNENIQPAENNLGPFSAGRAPSPQLSMSPRLIPSVSSFPMLPSKINELHELPRPPMISRKPVMSSSLVGYSGPLLPKSGPYADSAMLSNAASPLPTPPQAIARSFSIPSSAQRSDTMTDFLEASHNADAHKEISSPPLALISLSSSQPSKRLASISSGGIKTKGSL